MYNEFASSTLDDGVDIDLVTLKEKERSNTIREFNDRLNLEVGVVGAKHSAKFWQKVQ